LRHAGRQVDRDIHSCIQLKIHRYIHTGRQTRRERYTGTETDKG